MRKLNLALFFFAFFFAFMQANAQNAQWALYPIQKFDVASGSLTSLASNHTPDVYACDASTGLFDAAGNPVFYVAGRNLYDKNGTVIYDLGASPQVGCPKGVTIVPVPGATCAEYFIVYAIPIDLQNVPNVPMESDGYVVNALRVRVGNNYAITVLNNDREYYPSLYYVAQVIGIAVGKEANGARRVFATFPRDAGAPDREQIVELRLDNSGLTPVGGFHNAYAVGTLHAPSIELSPNQQYLAWASSQSQITVRNLVTNTNMAMPSAGLDGNEEIEFNAASSLLYVTTSAGIVAYNFANGTVSAPIANTSAFYGGSIEMGLNNRLYIAGNNTLAYYDLTNQSLTSTVVAYAGKNLPEQVDGENIKFNGITSYGGAMSLGVPAACSTNPFMANLSGLNQGATKSVTVKVTDDANTVYMLASGNLTIGATYGLNLSNIAGTGLSVYINNALPCAKNLKVSFTYNNACGYSQEISNTTSLPCCCTTATYNYSLSGHLTTCPGDDDATAIFAGNYTFEYLTTGGVNVNASPSRISQGYLALSGLAVGSYQVKVTGAGGCSTIRTITVTAKPNCCNPCPLSVKVTEANGILTANVTGGSGNYSYVWNTVGGTNYSTSQTLTPCGNQTHSLKVTDNTTGCVKIISFQYAAAFTCQTPPVKGLRAQSTDAGEPLKVYPNPTTDFIQIEAGEAIIEQVQMIDMQGKVVATEAGKGNQMRLSTQNAGNGMYILHIATDKGTFQKKVSVQK